MIVNAKKIMKETDLIIVNQMNIVSKERILKIYGPPI